MIPGVGGPELIIILVILLLLFGARRIPELGRSLGGGVREFKRGISGEKPPQREAQAEHSAPSGGPVRDGESPGP